MQRFHRDPEKRRPFSNYLFGAIDADEHLLEAELLLLAFATGIQDAVSFPRLHCFVSNQTGNTVLFAVAAFTLLGDQSTTDFLVPIPHIATSLALFISGVFVAGQTANALQCHFARVWLIVSNAIQTVMALVAALLLFLNPTASNSSAAVLGTIALLAFSSGAQVAMSRQLRIPEIPTAQATAAYVDLFIDNDFFAKITKNRGRNRRICFLIVLCAGSFVGAAAFRFVSPAFTLFISGIGKLVATLLFFTNRNVPMNRARLTSIGTC